jgi:acetyl esterase/lipase
MKAVVNLLVIVAVVISFVGAEAGELPFAVPDGVTFVGDIAYRPGESKAWRLDLAMPTGRGDEPRPAIVFVHGGGWRNGDKRAGNFLGPTLEFAAKGYVCITVNYRLLGEAPMPACMEDVKCAVRWLRAHAKEYNVDTKRFGAYGNSAGAHLVSMLGLCGPEAGLEGDGPWKEHSSMVQAVVASATPTNFLVPINNRQRQQTSSGNSRVGWTDELKKKMSPATYVRADVPPFLLFHSTSDQTVGVHQSDDFAKALREAGAKDITYKRYDDQSNHGVFGRHIKETGPAREAFFDRVLKHKSKPLPKTWKGFNARRAQQGGQRQAQERAGGSDKAIAERLKAFFDKNDADKSGDLSKEEFPERLKRGFDRMDRDRSGTISKGEYRGFLNWLRRNSQQSKE